MCGYLMPADVKQCQQSKCGAFQHPLARVESAVRWLLLGPLGIVFGAFLFDPTVKDMVNSWLYDPDLKIESFIAAPEYIGVKMRNAGGEDAILENLVLLQRYKLDGKVVEDPLTDVNVDEQELIRRLAPPANVIAPKQFWQKGEFVGSEASALYPQQTDAGCRIVLKVWYGSGDEGKPKLATKSAPC